MKKCFRSLETFFSYILLQLLPDLRQKSTNVLKDLTINWKSKDAFSWDTLSWGDAILCYKITSFNRWNAYFVFVYHEKFLDSNYVGPQKVSDIKIWAFHIFQIFSIWVSSRLTYDTIHFFPMPVPGTDGRVTVKIFVGCFSVFLQHYVYWWDIYNEEFSEWR